MVICATGKPAMEATAFVFLVILQIAFQQERDCLLETVCHLLLGDIHKLAKKDFSLNYNNALEAMANYETHKSSAFSDLGFKTNQLCWLKTQQCNSECRKAAKIYFWEIPVHIIDDCPPASWHFSLFDCKHVLEWPKKITNGFPEDFKVCKQGCHLLAKVNEYHPSPGKPLEANGTLNLDRVLAIARSAAPAGRKVSTAPRRRIYSYVERFKEGEAEGEIGQVRECPKGKWLRPFRDYTFTPFIPFQIDLQCSDKPLEDAVFDSKGERIGPLGFLISARYRVTKTVHQTGYGKIQVDELSPAFFRYRFGGVNKNWVAKNWTTIDKIEAETIGWGNDLECPYRTAACSYQYTTIKINGKTLLTNARYGCCDVPLDKQFFAESYIILPYTTKKGELFADMNYRTVPLAATKGESQERIFMCPPGQFIDEYVADIVRTKHTAGRGYSNKLAYIRTQFFCNTLSKQTPSGPLTTKLYDSDFRDSVLRGDHVINLGRFKCQNGIFTEVELDLAYDGGTMEWERSMFCSETQDWLGETDAFLKDSEAFSISADEGGAGYARCPKGYGLCGVAARHKNKLGSQKISLEAYYFRYYCCEVPTMFRCDEMNLQIKRLTSQCPTNHVAADTLCNIVYGYGISHSLTEKTGGETGSSSSHDWEAGLASKLNNTFNAGLSYSGTFSKSQGFSWSNEHSTSSSRDTSVTIWQTIPAGSKVITAQPIFICGILNMRANQTIQYITPSVKCLANDTYERIHPPDFPKNIRGLNVTIRGFGLELTGQVRPQQELEVSWKELSEGVKEKFTYNSDLSRFSWTDYNWRNAEESVWEEYDSKYEAKAFFDIAPRAKPSFYRVVGRCNNHWAVRTKFVRMTLTDDDFQRQRFRKPSAYFEISSDGTYKSVLNLL